MEKFIHFTEIIGNEGRGKIEHDGILCQEHWSDQPSLFHSIKISKYLHDCRMEGGKERETRRKKDVDCGVASAAGWKAVV